MHRHIRTVAFATTCVLATGCLDEAADDDVGERAAALTPVTWTDVVGASAAGNDLTKTAPESAWNAGAVSVETLSNDGFVEFTTDEATTFKMAGLSNGNAGQGQADVDFAIRLSDTGRVAIFEGGINRAAVGTYAAGDVFRVQVQGGVVTYWRNSSLLYTSAGTPIFPLLVDTSLFTPGATIRDAAVQSLLFWENVVGAQATGNDLSKTGIATAWDAGATSIASIPAGDGYIEFAVADATTLKSAGLSNGNGGQSYTDIDFALYLSVDGGVAIYEAGIKIGNFRTYESGDRFRVQVLGGVVTYWRNDKLLYTSTGSPTYPLVLDSSLRTPGTAILDARVHAGSIPGCAPSQQTLLRSSTQDFGKAVDAGGDVLVVGSSVASVGRAEVYRRSPDGWMAEQTLTRDGGSNDSFGREVATDGQTIAVGGRNDLLGGDRGSVEVYRHDGATWVDEDVLRGCYSFELVGGAIAVQGDRIVAGAPGGFGGDGRAFVFRRGAVAWHLEAVLEPSDGRPGGNFGSAVAIGGDRIFVGARDTVNPAGNAGAVYVYRYDPTLPKPAERPTCFMPHPGKWVQETVLYASDSRSLGGYGLDASSDGLRLIAGFWPGTALVFSESGGAWSETARLQAFPDTFVYDVTFGGPDAGNASVAVIGASDIPDPGYALVFAEQGGAWTPTDFVTSFSGDASYFYGSEVTAVADTLFIADSEVGDGEGAVYVHGIDPVCLPE